MRKNILIAFSLTICICLSGCSSSEESKQYKEAQKLLENKQYSEALTIYENLAGLEKPYKDSVEKVQKCYGEIARQYYTEADYKNAQEYYEKAGYHNQAEDCRKRASYPDYLNSKLEGYNIEPLTDIKVISYTTKTGEHSGAKLGSALLSSDKFEALSKKDKLSAMHIMGFTLHDIFNDIISWQDIQLQSGDATYTVEGKGYTNIVLKKDGSEVYDVKESSVHPSYDSYYNKTPKRNKSGISKCPMCNGTGSAKFYYGDSDLQALLEGHDPYWFDTCPLCNGTGEVDD